MWQTHEGRKSGGRASWVATCSGCQTVFVVDHWNVVSGKSKSCRWCAHPRQVPVWLTKRVNAMAQRCRNPKNPAFRNYGGRGVEFQFPSVLSCALWIQENLGLQVDMELDRVDNSGHYAPGNLKWSTKEENNRNKRTTKVPTPMAVSPYAPTTTARLQRSGMTPGQIVEHAKLAVLEKRKGWRTIAARLESMTS